MVVCRCAGRQAGRRREDPKPSKVQVQQVQAARGKIKMQCKEVRQCRQAKERGRQAVCSVCRQCVCAGVQAGRGRCSVCVQAGEKCVKCDVSVCSMQCAAE